MTVEGLIIEEDKVREDPSPGFGQGQLGMARYLFTIAAVVALLYLTPFFLARTALYQRWNPSFYARPLDYAFNTAGENADVLLFGDSTALLGIDPSQMSSALGVKVLNLVNTQPSLIVSDDMSLRHYLSANRAPKVIVFYFAPWDFDYGHVDIRVRPTYEGEELLLRQGTRREQIAFVKKHPRELLLFPLKFYASAWHLTTHPVAHANQDAQLASTKGHIDNADDTVLREPCHFPQYLIDNVRFSWVHDLGERYRTPQTRVFFFVAPVPACDNAAAVAGRPFDALPASPPLQLPTTLFTKDVRFLHPRASAVPQLTRNLIDALRPVLDREGISPAAAAPRSHWSH